MTYPEYGTAQIKCAKRKCGWTGTERDMVSIPHPKFECATQQVCPSCGYDEYVFVKQKKSNKEQQ